MHYDEIQQVSMNIVLMVCVFNIRGTIQLHLPFSPMADR
jgi:hypothetical protein